MVACGLGSRTDVAVPDVLPYDVHHLWPVVPLRQEVMSLGNPCVTSHCLIMDFLEQMQL